MGSNSVPRWNLANSVTSASKEILSSRYGIEIPDSILTIRGIKGRTIAVVNVDLSPVPGDLIAVVWEAGADIALCDYNEWVQSALPRPTILGVIEEAVQHYHLRR